MVDRTKALTHNKHFTALPFRQHARSIPFLRDQCRLSSNEHFRTAIAFERLHRSRLRCLPSCLMKDSRKLPLAGPPPCPPNLYEPRPAGVGPHSRSHVQCSQRHSRWRYARSRCISHNKSGIKARATYVAVIQCILFQRAIQELLRGCSVLCGRHRMVGGLNNIF